ncbi:MAG TPA: formyltransferase family protein [Thermomicrobiaceae bacterium]|nr:formyltransferase family protein [Thermomicrobiaceae bacterium]
MSVSNGKASLRVVMFTVSPFYIPIAEDLLRQKGHRLVGVVSAPGPRTRRTDDYLEVGQYARPGRDVIISNYPNRWAAMIRPLKPDLLYCLSFNWTIPAEVLQVPRLGAINVHDALLPKYRGRNATGWALRNDEPELGMTVHFMTPELDNGPILSQRRVPISDADLNLETIYQRFAGVANEGILEALERVAAGDPGTPQDETQVTHAGGAFEPEWREIDWGRTAREIFVQVRSWYGARDVPLGAFGEIEGRRMLITKTKLVDESPSGLAPGSVIRTDPDGILIQCADRPLLVVAAEPVAPELDELLPAEPAYPS